MKAVFTPPILHDDILRSILARLTGKCLLRFRCVSKHWNRLISDPCFMKWRSRRMILLKYSKPHHVVIDPKEHSVVVIPSVLEKGIEHLSVIGTHNGVVVLIIETDWHVRTHMYLYNPLTRASKLLDVMYRPSQKPTSSYDFGFGYGATQDDLKIVRFGDFTDSQYTCDVFDIKTSSWGKSPIYLKRDFCIWYAGHVSINGYMYWLITRAELLGILALNVKDMVFSNVDLPKSGQDPPLKHPIVFAYFGVVLGSVNGHLCMVVQKKHIGFELWMMMMMKNKEQAWSKVHSFTFGLEANGCFKFRPVCILVNGKILLTDGHNQVVMYDTSKDSCVPILSNLSDHGRWKNIIWGCHSMEFVESLVLPSDICAAI